MFQGRLIQILKIQARADKGGVLGLVNAVKKANENRRHISRAKLTRILNGDASVTLHYDEIYALDVYLASIGIRIGGLFDKTDLIRDISRSNENELYLILGAKPIHNTYYISFWDIRSMAEVLRLVDKVPTGSLHHEIVPAVLRNSKDIGKASPMSVIEGEPWYALLDKQNGPPLVIVGSPRANNASEVVLARMFGVTPFCAYGGAATSSLPFHFSWGDETFTDLPSNFCVTRAHSRPTLYIGSTAYPVSEGSHRDEFGVIAVQRRLAGQLWMVIAGLTGVATMATAQIVPEFSIEPPLVRDEDPPAVAWAAVRAKIRGRVGPHGEDKTVVDVSFLTEPAIWQTPPATR